MISNYRGTFCGIKRTVFLFTLCLVFIASAKVVRPVPLGESLFVDTEVSTNVPAPACGVDPHRTSTSFNRKSDARVSAIEQEMSNMPQKLSGAGWKTMFWGNDLAKAIMALDDRGERIRLIDRYLDAMSELEPSLTVKNCYTLAFRNYEELIGTCTIFEGEPEIAERILGIMCDCIRLHRREVKKWADAIESEPNRRNRVPLKNVYRGLSSDFMMFTNHIERTYFPWMKAHGLPSDRHEHWRRKINAAYGFEATDKK